MSIVGPRPDLVDQVANYSELDRRRLAVLPGITGWSQVQGREEIGWPERFEQDAWYIEHWSLRLDAQIVFATFTQLFRSGEAPVEDTMNIERARARENGKWRPQRAIGARCWRGSVSRMSISGGSTSRARARSSRAVQLS